MAALGFLSKIQVEAGRHNEAKESISRLLDFEPPLVFIPPGTKYQALEELYEEVRRERAVKESISAPIESIAMFDFRPLNLTDSSLHLMEDLGSLFKYIMSPHFVRADYTILSRHGIFGDTEDNLNWLKKLGPETMPGHLISLFEPWIILDEDMMVKLNQKLLPATHYMFGTYMYNGTFGGDFRSSEILVSAWIYDTRNGFLHSAEYVQGPAPQFDELADSLAARFIRRFGPFNSDSASQKRP